MKKAVFVYMCIIAAFCLAEESKFNYVGSGRYVCTGGDACLQYKAARDYNNRREFDRKYEAEKSERDRNFEYKYNQRSYDKPPREFMK